MPAGQDFLFFRVLFLGLLQCLSVCISLLEEALESLSASMKDYYLVHEGVGGNLHVTARYS